MLLLEEQTEGLLLSLIQSKKYENMRKFPNRKALRIGTPVQTAVQWNTLLHVSNIGQYISSLAIWCFFSNYDANISRKKYLVLELEGVILHSTINQSSTEQIESNYDFYIQYIENNQTVTHFIALRPMLIEFLESASEWYEIVVYTSMNKTYTDLVLDRIEEGKKIFKRRMYRTDCDYFERKYVKDLEKVSEDLTAIVMLDSSYDMYNNKLPIEAFTGCIKDKYLLSTLIILDSLRYCSDVRSILELAYL